MKFLLDANVIVSALLSPESNAAKLLMGAAEGALDLLVPAELVRELEGVLSRPKFAHRIDPRAKVALSRRLRAIIQSTAGSPVRFDPDPGDAYLLRAAIAHRAILVTGDKDLLSAKLPFPVLTPRQACDALFT